MHRAFVLTLSLMAKNWTKYSDKLWHIYTLDYYNIIKMNELKKLVGESHNIMLSIRIHKCILCNSIYIKFKNRQD